MNRPEPPVFAEPWQAQAFALTVRLNESGQFTWSQWADHFGAALAEEKASSEAEEQAGYWQAWLRALERLLAARGMAGAMELDRLEAAWAEAYRTTPHGQPVELKR